MQANPRAPKNGGNDHDGYGCFPPHAFLDRRGPHSTHAPVIELHRGDLSDRYRGDRLDPLAGLICFRGGTVSDQGREPPSRWKGNPTLGTGRAPRNGGPERYAYIQGPASRKGNPAPGSLRETEGIPEITRAGPENL